MYTRRFLFIPSTAPIPTKRGRAHVHQPARCTAANTSHDPKVAQVLIIGGGAAGHLAAIACARRAHQHVHVLLLESTPAVLTKVRQSGGGRCNVTSGVDSQDMRAFSSNYPRGRLEMLGVLSKFGSTSVIDFFEAEGVSLKTEPGGKVFPVSDTSSTVTDALSHAARNAGVRVLTRTRVTSIQSAPPLYHVVTDKGGSHQADFVVIATGSARSAWAWAKSLGHSVVSPVPSLFTFGLPDARLDGLAGVAVDDVSVQLQVDSRARRRTPGLMQRGPVLITHWGLSGPAVLSLSAFAARLLFDAAYDMPFLVDWAPRFSLQEKQECLREARHSLAQKGVVTANPFRAYVPKRLWRALVHALDLHEINWSTMGNEAVDRLARELHAGVFRMRRKGQFKDEFVTAGGVALTDVNMKTFESKVSPRLFFAGETLDVDGRTGGYNLQFAWSSGYIAGDTIAQTVLSQSLE